MFSAGGQSMSTRSKSLRFGASAWRSLVSRPIGSVSNRTSAAVRSWLAGRSVKPAPCSIRIRASASWHSPSSTSQVLRSSCDLSTPLPIVVLPCGSMSMSSTRRLVAARDAARLTAVVVLPTPPFCIAMAMTRFMDRECTAPARPCPVSRTRATPRGTHCQAWRPVCRGGEPWALAGPERVSGDQRVRGPSEALACHLVRDLIRGTVLAPGALEDLSEACRNGLDVGDDLRLARPAVVLARDADDAAGIDDVVRCVEDASGLQRRPVLILRQLVVGGSRDDAGPQARNRPRIEHRPERARGEHIDIESKHLLRWHGVRGELLAGPIHGGAVDVGDEQLGALCRQQSAEMASDSAEALDRDLHALQICPTEAEFHGRLDAEVHPERGFRTRIAARLSGRRPEA